MMNDNIRHQAERQVERKLGFYVHLGTFLIVNSGLIVFNLSTAPEKLWAVWPLGGWGIGLLFHGLAVFLHPFRPAWKQRMVDKEMRKHRGKTE
jgi:hypothetical protein